MKSVFISVLLCSVVSFSINAQSWAEEAKIVNSDRNQNDNFGVAVSIDGNYAISGASQKGNNEGGPGNFLYAGRAYIYEKSGSNWAEVQQLSSPVPFEYDWFGDAVAISGDYAIVSAYRDDEDANEANFLQNSGSAYIYERDELGSWNLVQKITPNERTENAWFGISVAIQGETAVIGAQYERFDSNGENLVFGAGAAYVFTRNESGVWEETQKLSAAVRSSDDQFGIAVDIDGSSIIVGAFKEDHNEAEASFVQDAGSAYVFEFDGSSWTQTAKLVASDRGAYDNYGFGVAIDSGIAAVGAWGEDQDVNGGNTMSFSGSAYVYENSGGTWAFTQKIVAGDREEDAQFGLDLDISDGIILVGARFESEDITGDNPLTDAGAAYYFEKQDDNTWLETQKITNSDRNQYDYFSHSLALSGGVAILGAYTEDEDENGFNTQNSAGSAYIFSNVTCEPTSSTDNINACDEFTWIDGNTYTESVSDVSYLTLDILGCDSLVTLNLDLNYSSFGTDSIVACDSLTWIDGITYYESASNLEYLTTTTQGCDSLSTLHLTILDPSELVLGCTYADAINYNPAATLDDGSCAYNGFFCVFDGNADGFISSGDLTLFLSVFGTSCE